MKEGREVKRKGGGEEYINRRGRTEEVGMKGEKMGKKFQFQ